MVRKALYGSVIHTCNVHVTATGKARYVHVCTIIIAQHRREPGEELGHLNITSTLLIQCTVRTCSSTNMHTLHSLSPAASFPLLFTSLTLPLRLSLAELGGGHEEVSLGSPEIISQFLSGLEECVYLCSDNGERDAGKLTTVLLEVLLLHFKYYTNCYTMKWLLSG